MPESGSPVPVSLLDDETLTKAAVELCKLPLEFTAEVREWPAREWWMGRAHAVLLASGLPQKLAEAKADEEHWFRVAGERDMARARVEEKLAEAEAHADRLAHLVAMFHDVNAICGGTCEPCAALAEHRERREGRA